MNLDYVRRTPSATLLVVQLAGVLLYPWFEDSPKGRAVFAAFGLVVLGVALRVVRRSPWATWLAFVLAVLVVLLSVIFAITPHPALPIAIAALQAAFYFYAAGSLIAYMMQDWVATTDELFAAGATFTLLVWGFAYTYLACQAVFPGSFSGPVDPAARAPGWSCCFSASPFCRVSGLSDILPVTPFARALVMLEAFSGVMYIALVVSRLVALTVVAKKESGKKKKKKKKKRMECSFSVSVVSGVGLSDVLPVRPFARALVMLEAFPA